MRELFDIIGTTLLVWFGPLVLGDVHSQVR
jgi:hypothetical protein